ncbi:DNA adenine methylase [Phenylobacterium sp.]|uniref:DNA adenine methylase n=1 Tax=Phenylobacterium sp. TaxID=1871053 RepID=UPI00394C4D64
MESSPPRTPVRPIRPAAPYIGGKRNLARRLVDLIEATPHRTYAEPFVGMGGVFLRRLSRPPAEVVNDWSRDVVTFYRILQRHPVAFLEMLRWQFSARAEFDRLMTVDPDTLTDLERAARFLYLQRQAFGGKVTSRHFGVAINRPSRVDVTRLQVILDELHDRLAGVVIERLRWQEFVARYDTPETLFYLDPPYYDCERDYGPGMFGREEFAEMAEILAGLKGRFILSLNDVPEVREVFAAFQIETVTTHYGLAGRGAQPAGEVIITSPGLCPAPRRTAAHA